MRLSDFIVTHLDEILSSWIVRVRHAVSVAAAIDDAALEDDARELLAATAHALGSGAGPQSMAAVADAARAHAANRLAQGFSLDQMIAEYCAVRSDVLHRWTDTVRDFSREAHDDQLRFNDVLDRAVAASTAHYALRLELARDLFLGVLGHDLRTPLAAIAHSASLLRRGDAGKEQQVEAIERIAKSAQRMDLMIQDLLDFTRSRLGTQLPVNPAPCDIEAIARQAIDELTAFHPGTSIVFKPSGNLHGTWDSGRVMQLLSNLVDNAIRHRTGEEPVTVELRGNEDEVSIAVHNVGQVISPSEQKAIFDPLRRGMYEDPKQPPPGSTAGLGLGLYISLQIATSHGGGIQLTSTVEHGTCFVATLPRKVGGEVGSGDADRA